MEVRTQEEFETAQRFLEEIQERIWLGGSDIQEEGVWIWASNDERINMDLLWRDGEPNNGGSGSEHCLDFVTEGFNDNVCTEKYYFVCEIF